MSTEYTYKVRPAASGRGGRRFGTAAGGGEAGDVGDSDTTNDVGECGGVPGTSGSGCASGRAL